MASTLISATDGALKHRLSQPRNSRFTDLSLLGQGTYGDVWKAHDLKLNKNVAIKRFKEVVCPKWGFSVTIMREISVMKALEHQNVVKLLDVIGTDEWTNDGFFLILELHDGDLDKWLDKHTGKICLDDCRNFSRQILSGCKYLHDRNVMHRDIKPDNILINERTKKLKIADMGLARLFEESPDKLYSSHVQALWYRAPELLLGQRVYGPAIDVWSIGYNMYNYYLDGLS